MPDTDAFIERQLIVDAVAASPHRRRAHAEQFVGEEHLLYAFWRVRGSNEAFLVRELDGEWRVFRLREPHTATRNHTSGICTICCSNRPPGATALWTAAVGKRKIVGNWICFDFDCALGWLVRRKPVRLYRGRYRLFVGTRTRRCERSSAQHAA